MVKLETLRMNARQKFIATKSGEADKLLKGKVVKTAWYMTDTEASVAGFDTSPLVVEFTDGSAMYAQRDPEGNGAGSLVAIPAKGKPKLFGDI